MSLEVRPVLGAGDRRRFVTFPIDALYRGHPCYVPQLIRDELDTLTPGRNPAFEQAEARLFLATELAPAINYPVLASGRTPR